MKATHAMPDVRMSSRSAAAVWLGVERTRSARVEVQTAPYTISDSTSGRPNLEISKSCSQSGMDLPSRPPAATLECAIGVRGRLCKCVVPDRAHLARVRSSEAHGFE